MFTHLEQFNTRSCVSCQYENFKETAIFYTIMRYKKLYIKSCIVRLKFLRNGNILCKHEIQEVVYHVRYMIYIWYKKLYIMSDICMIQEVVYHVRLKMSKKWLCFMHARVPPRCTHYASWKEILNKFGYSKQVWKFQQGYQPRRLGSPLLRNYPLGRWFLALGVNTG